MLTSYNGYDCVKDRRHLFTPEELEAIRQADARIEAWYAEMYRQRAAKPRSETAADRHKRKAREYYHAHKCDRKAYFKAYYEDHKEECLAKQAAWRAQHLEQAREYNRKYSRIRDEKRRIERQGGQAS